MLKILIIRLSSIGDIIHTYPMIKDIKNNINCSIDWIIDEDFVELLKYNNNVDNIISIPLRKWKKNKFKFIFRLLKWKKKLKDIEYDYIIDSQGLLKSAILTKFFNGVSYGYDFYSIREKIASIFYNKKINVSKLLLATSKNRVLSQKVFNYHIDKNKIDFGMQKYYSNRLLNYNYIIFFHATSNVKKEYSFINWINIAKYVLSNTNLKIVLPYGSMIEKQKSLAIKNYINSDNIIVPDSIFNFKELHSLIYNAEFILGVDTGLIHLSNALNKKLIAIYTYTNPNKTGIVESNIAINIGGINVLPNYNEIISIFNKIIKI